MNKEVRTLTRWEKIINEWVETVTTHSRSNVRGVVTETEYTVSRRFVLVQTHLATVMAYYNGIPLPHLKFSVYFSENGEIRAREEAESLMQRYGVQPSDPLVLNVVTWERKEEWAETLPQGDFLPSDIFYYRTETPAQESERVVFWASNSTEGTEHG